MLQHLTVPPTHLLKIAAGGVGGTAHAWSDPRSRSLVMNRQGADPESAPCWVGAVLPPGST